MPVGGIKEQMLEDLIRKNRSYRRFHQGDPVPREALEDLINLARLGASASNLQPLRFLIAGTPGTCAQVFPTLKWAGYLTDWPGPEEGQRPPAYIVILGDTTVTENFHCDHGIAAQSILLGAVEKGLGGCIIGSINKPALTSALSIPAHLEVLLVLALGRPAETVVIEQAEGDIRYWRDKRGVHHVPKRSMEEIILNLPDKPDTTDAKV